MPGARASVRLGRSLGAGARRLGRKTSSIGRTEGIDMSNRNVVLARRWFEEVWNHRRADTIDELLTDESVCHTESGPLRGKQEFRERTHAVFLSAFPDLRMTVEGTVAEDDQVVVRWAATATHLGDGL